LVATGATLGLAVRVHRVTSTGRLALATTVRVVDRVHGHTADGRALALPPHPAGLTPVDVGLLGVADLADGGAAADVDVANLAGGVVQQRDPSRAVRVVLDVRDLGRHTVLVVPAEVDQPVRALVAAALVPSGDLALVVAAALVVQRTHQRLLREVTGDLDEVG